MKDKAQWGTLVINTKILLSIIICLFFSSISISQSNNIREQIVLQVFEEMNNSKSKKYYLDINNENIYLENLFETYSKFNNSKQKDSINRQIGIAKHDTLINLFKGNELNYFKKQLKEKRRVKVWGNNILKIANSDYHQTKKITITYPIFSQEEDIALLHIVKETMSYVLVLKKKSNVWEEYGIFSAMIF